MALLRALLIFGILFVAIGCGGVDRGELGVTPASSIESPLTGVDDRSDPSVAGPVFNSSSSATLASTGNSASAVIPKIIAALTNQSAAAPPPEAVQRRIIYEARVTITVEEFSGAEQKLADIVTRHGGYISQSGFSGRTLGQRQGIWTIRVPVEQYRTLQGALDGLGELQERTETSREVTAEFVDLQARVANKNREEQRLLQLLDTHSAKLEEVLNVERELSRVREEIERMQGQLRLLENQTALSTIHLTVQELQQFVPAETPGFVTLATRTWNDSTGLLMAFGRSLALFAIGLAPWTVVIMPILCAMLLVNRPTRPRSGPVNAIGGR